MKSLTEYTAPLPEGRRLLPWLWYFARPHKWPMMFHLLCRVVRTALFACQPYFITRIVEIYTATSIDRTAGAMWVAISCGSFVVSTTLIRFGGNERSLIDKIRRSVTVQTFGKYMRMPLAWHETEGSGARLQRMLTGVEGLERLYQIIFWPGAYLLGALVGAFVTLLLVGQPLLTVWFVAFFLTYVRVSFYFAMLRSRVFGEYFRDREGAVKNLFDFSTSVATVKTYGLTPFIQRRVKDAEISSHNLMSKLWHYFYQSWFWLNFVGAFFFVGTMLWLFRSVHAGALSITLTLTVTWVFWRAWSALEEVVEVQSEWVRARGAMERLTDDLRVEEVSLDSLPAQKLLATWKTVRFDGVSYQYATRDEPSLEGVTLAIECGKKVALVGHSGAGKTTLVKLLTKLMLPTSGKISIDGVDLAQIPGDAWRRHLAIVPQEVEVLNTTIRDNVLLDRTDVADAALWHCLELAQAAEFIRALPQGLETPVGERGVKLSGGQKQRLGIARALVRGADVIIFDEATSQLDAESEHALQRALATAFAGKTLILIAHRLATIRQADRIFVLQDGRAVEEGTLAELLEKKGRFADFWELQVGV